MAVHRSLKTFIAVIALFSLLSVVSCASLGTKVRIERPEAVRTIRNIAVWPIVVVPTEKKFQEVVGAYILSDENLQARCIPWSRFADSCLFEELSRRTTFDLIGPDSTTSLMRLQKSTFDRFDAMIQTDFRGLAFADGILVTEVSFGREGYRGINTYVTMSIYNQPEGALVVQVSFNTKWGKSYLLEQGPETTMPDAFRGAINALRKTFVQSQP